MPAAIDLEDCEPIYVTRFPSHSLEEKSTLMMLGIARSVFLQGKVTGGRASKFLEDADAGFHVPIPAQKPNTERNSGESKQPHSSG